MFDVIESPPPPSPLECKLEDHLTVKKMVERYKNHPRIEAIRENFNISLATIEKINNIIKNLFLKTPTGLNKIPPKMVKLSANVIDSSIDRQHHR